MSKKKSELEQSYQCSDNHDRLVELINLNRKIICFIDESLSDKNDFTYRKMVITRDLSAFDTVYLAFNESKDPKVFIEFCKSVNLTFIDTSI